MTEARRSWAALAVVAAGLALSACGGGPAEQQDATEITIGVSGVTVEGFAYKPTVLTVEPGTTVEWTNDDKILHTVTSGKASASGVPGVSEDVPAEPDGAFDLALDGEGSKARFMFEEAGTFTYYCSIHAGMNAQVEVKPAA